MADNIQEGQENQGTQAQSQQQVIAPELAAQMEQSLAMWTGEKPASDEGAQQQQAAAQPQNNNEVAPFTFETLKEKFGYETPDAVIKEIEELRVIKANPPKAVVEPLKFENEESERFYNAVTKGDKKKAIEIWQKQERIDSFAALEVNKDNAAEVIKFGMSISNPDLTPDEIEFQYKQEYVAPKEPVQKATEDETEFSERMEEWKEKCATIEMKRVIAAKMAKPQIQAAKQNLVLPEITTEVDPEYLQWKKSLEIQKESNEEIVNAYKDVTPEKVGMKINFIDEKNKVDFNFDYQPDDKQYKQALDIVGNFQLFFDHFKKPDGTPDREGFMQAVIFALNRKEIMTEGLKQAKNGTIKSKLPDNDSGGLVRQIVTAEGEKSEFDKQMQQSLAPWQRKTGM